MATQDILVPFNFLGLPDELSSWAQSRIVIIPVPYDLTTSYLPGTRRGPLAIIEASTHMELFDEEMKHDISSVGIHTLGQLEPDTADPQQMIKRVERVVIHCLKNNKYPVVLGGEHSISLGAVNAIRTVFPECGVVQFDAHADLRDTYLGSPYNHACIARRISELCTLHQAGIRSLSRDEYDFLMRSKIPSFFAHEIRTDKQWVKKLIDGLPAHIYITIDLDVLDPAIMAAVGTPEPGGIGWYDLLYAVRTLAKERTVVGFDIVELCPHPSNPGPDFLAAKLCYKLLGYVFE
jgi:agmatinase